MDPIDGEEVKNINRNIKKLRNTIHMNHHVFSRKQSLQDALETKIRRAKIMAKNKCNPDFNIKHPDWCRDYKTPEKMINDITKEVQDKQQKALVREEMKLV